MKVSELTGNDLDIWVARAEGHAVQQVGEGQWKEQWPAGHWHWLRHPSSTWADAGPIIERDGIELHCIDRNGRRMGEWMARHPARMLPLVFGPTPLIAAMRAYVASKFGEEVPDPS